MRTRRLLFAIPAAVLLLPISTPAAPTPGAAHDTILAAAASVDTARIRSLLAKGDEALFAGRVREARKHYRAAVNEQRAVDAYASTALWRLAQSHLQNDDTDGAGRVLDELAEAAARYGDPTMELSATFEAAIYNKRRLTPSALEARVGRITALLQSPAIAPEVKERYRRRLVQK